MTNTNPLWLVHVGRIRIDARWWLLAIGLAAVAIRLGIWQMDRAELKEAMQRRYYDRLAMTAEPCANVRHAGDAQEAAFFRVSLAGRFVPGKEYLWDNRTYHGEAGYEVLTPFVCNDGTQLLVDRGWIGTGKGRDQLPRWETPVTPVNLVGFVFVPASGGALFNWFTSSEWPSAWPKRIGRLDLERIAQDQQLGGKYDDSSARQAGGRVANNMYPYPIIVDGPGSGTFAYNFEPASVSPIRNRGYVVQWFAIAAGILGYLGYRSWQRQ